MNHLDAMNHLAAIYGLDVATVERLIARAHTITDRCLPAALANPCVAYFIEHGSEFLNSFNTLEKRREFIQKNIPLRLVFEHGYALTDAVHPSMLPGSWRNGKSRWGQFLDCAPLEEGDLYTPVRVGWVWTSGNEAFNRRMRLKEMLGPGARRMVEDARRDTLTRFLAGMNPDKQETLRLRVGLSPAEFWRAVKGNTCKREPVAQQAALFDIINGR